MFLIAILTLVQCKSIAFIRHGIRSPNDYNNLDKQLWGSFPPGFLTQKGFDQVKQMASNNFTHNCKYEDFRMVSSVKQRVMQSVVAFIMGLCPNNYEDILMQYFKDYYQQYSTNQTNFEQIIASQFKDPFSLNFDYFAMKPDFLFHGHKSEQCPLIDVLDDALYSSAEYEEINQHFRQHQQYESVLKQYQLCIANNQTYNLTITQIKKFYSSILCNEAEGIYNYNLSQQQQDYLMNIFKFQYYGIDYSQPLQQQSSLSYILKWLFEELYTESEWSFYYGHDDNQYALLSAITDEHHYVKFAGRLVFTLINDKLNVFLDDRLLVTKFCELGVDCPIDLAIKYLNRYINVNLERDCQLIK